MHTADFLQKTFALPGRVALVTGGSGGLGAHFAHTLARAGCKVIIAARRRKKLDAVAASIQADGGEVAAVELDVTQPDSVAAAMQQSIRAFGRLDILINNAGVAASRDFLAMEEREWQYVLDTNLSAVWRVGQAAAKQMTAQENGGVIVNIASILGRTPQRKQANYGAAKAGVIHLTKIMALELAAHKIRVNALAPGYFATDMNREFLNSDRGRKYITGLLPRRAGQLNELDGALLLLASDAGGYINGSVLTVDGGAQAGGL